MSRTLHRRPLRSAANPPRGFTLLEVVVALAMFAIIAAPTLGIITLAARKAHDRMGMVEADELKRRVAGELERMGAEEDDVLPTIFEWDFAEAGEGGDGPLAFYASGDLKTVKHAGDETLLDSEKRFRIRVLEPDNYDYAPSAGYRLLLFEVVWPAWIETSGGNYVSNEGPEAKANREQMILSHLVRK